MFLCHCSRWPCLDREGDLGDPQRSLPTPLLWDPVVGVTKPEHNVLPRFFLQPGLWMCFCRRARGSGLCWCEQLVCGLRAAGICSALSLGSLGTAGPPPGRGCPGIYVGDADGSGAVLLPGLSLGNCPELLFVSTKTSSKDPGLSVGLWRPSVNQKALRGKLASAQAALSSCF